MSSPTGPTGKASPTGPTGKAGPTGKDGPAGRAARRFGVAGEALTGRGIFRMWAPMAAAWMLFSLEGLIVAALVARLPFPKENLAAYGVAFAFVMLLSSPVVMMLSASTALVKNREAFRSLRRFSRILSWSLSALLLGWLLSPLWPLVAEGAMQLEPDVAERAWWALLVFVPGPAVLAYRRFAQGILVAEGQTRAVALGTILRIGGIALTALVLFDQPFHGAAIGTAAHIAGGITEGIATRFLAAGAVRRVLAVEGSGEPLTMRRITDFYGPLVVSSALTIALIPVVNVFLGHSRLALESLATFPVILSLSLVFRGLALSFQEVAIALMDGVRERMRQLVRFALRMGVGITVAQAAFALSPLSGWWFERVAGLDPELRGYAVSGFAILVLLPLLQALVAYWRGQFIWSRQTRVVTWAGFCHLAALVPALWLLTQPFGLVGVFAGCWGIFFGLSVETVTLGLWSRAAGRGTADGAASPAA